MLIRQGNVYFFGNCVLKNAEIRCRVVQECEIVSNQNISNPATEHVLLSELIIMEMTSVELIGLGRALRISVNDILWSSLCSKDSEQP